MGAGRPEEYSLETAEIICNRLIEGEPLCKICDDPDMPVRATVYAWLDKHPEFLNIYTRARDLQAETYFDQATRIADDPQNDWEERYGKDGEFIGFAPNHEHISRSKLRVDTRLRVVAMMKPRKYGVSVVKQQLSGPNDGPIETKEINRNDIVRRLMHLMIDQNGGQQE